MVTSSHWRQTSAKIQAQIKSEESCCLMAWDQKPHWRCGWLAARYNARVSPLHLLDYGEKSRTENVTASCWHGNIPLSFTGFWLLGQEALLAARFLRKAPSKHAAHSLNSNWVWLLLTQGLQRNLKLFFFLLFLFKEYGSVAGEWKNKQKV